MRQTKGMLAILIILIAVININAVLASIGVPTSNLTFISSNDGSQIYRNSNGWFKENVILNITSTDPDGIRGILYVTGGGTTTYSFSGPTTTYTTNPNISIEGSTIINYYAIDMMGNQEPPNNETIKLDRTLPYIIASVSPPANLNGWLNINAIVNFTAVDSLSGVAEIKGNTTVVTEGIKDVCGNATDIAGNINLTCVNVKIDKNAPVTSASLSGTAGNNGWNTSDVSVSLNTNDSISGVSGRFYNLNNTGWIIYSSPIPISTEGSNSIQYNSSDYAGNIEETKTQTVNIDKTKPAVTNISLSQFTSKMNNPVNITVDIEDLNLNASSIFVEVKHPSGYSFRSLMDGLRPNYFFNYTNTSEYGRYNVTIIASDEAGNINDTEKTWLVTTLPPYVNSSVNTTANNVTKIDALEKANTTLELFTSNDTTGGVINITLSNELPPEINQTFSLTSLGKYITINASEDLKNNLTSGWIIIKLYYTSAELNGLDENSLKISWYNETSKSWENLASGSPTWVNAAGVAMADVNGFAGYVWANISHLSTFGIVGNYPPASQPILSNGGGGGGGGGGGVSGENYYNIEIKEKYDFYIYKDKTTSFGFKNSSNPIVYVNITGNVNAGERSTSVEVLRKTSTLLNISAPDIVYKNVNIWVGTSGFATSKNIKEAVIGFKVSNSWLTDNSINAADIKLVKWDGSNWVQLETMKTKADSTYTYYDAKTITFSNFAITGIKAALSEVPLEMASNESITSTPPAEISKPVTSEKAPAVNLVVIVAGILIVAIFIVLYIKYKKP